MILEEYTRKRGNESIERIHIKYKCDICNRVSEMCKKDFKDKSYLLCNRCFIPKHICTEKCDKLQTCTKCGILKPLKVFVKSKVRKSGHVIKCQSCSSIKTKQELTKMRFKNIGHNCENSKCHEETRYCAHCKDYLLRIFFPIDLQRPSCHHSLCFFHNYKRGAIRRNRNRGNYSYNFEITKEQTFKLITQKCYGCGKDPTKIKLMNGIDRVDNNEGYTIDNCKALCSMCNMEKLDRTYEQFIRHRAFIILNNYENLDYWKSVLEVLDK